MSRGLHIADICRLPMILRRERWNAQRLRAYQEQRLRAIVRHAYARVPYYRDLWDTAGVAPESVKTLEDLPKLPALNAREYKGQPGCRLIADGTDADDCIVSHTSGSTGQPLAVTYTHRDYFELVKAMSVRFYRANGVKLTDKILTLARNPSIMTTRSWFQRLGIWKRTVLPVMDDAQTWLEPTIRLQPDIITGFTLSLVELARALSRHPGGQLRPRIVFTSGCRLEPADRQLLETAFGARVVDSYGGYETGFLAWQCPTCPGYHVNTDCVLLEVLRDGRPANPGETGDVFITNLASQAMPFIRYPLGDVVTLSNHQPSCGRALPLIEVIWGRSDDYVRLPSGKKIGPYPFYLLVLAADWIREWRLTQHHDGTCVLQIAPRDDSNRDSRSASMQAGLDEILRHEVAGHIEFVESIERDLKTKWTSITSDYDAGQKPRLPGDGI